MGGFRETKEGSYKGHRYAIVSRVEELFGVRDVSGVEVYVDGRSLMHDQFHGDEVGSDYERGAKMYIDELENKLTP